MADSDMARIEGQVIYRERIQLPPGAQVEVHLLDVSRADTLATEIASVMLTPDSGPPYAFAIEYDTADIAEGMTYALRATITSRGQLRFTTTDYINPFTGNPVEVLVRGVPSPPPVENSTPLEGTAWILQTLDGEPAPAGAGDRPADLQFLAEEGVVAGFSGCNRYSGKYSRNGDYQHGSPLSLGPLAGTLMACTEGGELERAFLDMLGRVSAFHLQGDTLILLSGADRIATFKAA